MKPVAAPPLPSGANRRPVYLDNQSTTPLDPRVLDAMLPYFTEQFGNPHSESHVYGKDAAAAVERGARTRSPRLIGADPREIVFTSGATEANNLALKGAAHFARAHPQPATSPRDHIVTLATEHKCVLESAAALEREGFEVTYLPVEPNGLVSLDRLAAALDERTLLVSVMAAHNEIGVIQPLAEIGALCRVARRAVPHRRGAGLRQDPARCRGDEDRPDVDLRPQDLRSEGRRRALCPAPAARAPVAAVRRRRAGARLALRHVADPALRRSRPRRGDRRARKWTTEAARLRRLARPAAGEPDAPCSAGCGSTATPSTGCPAT